MTVYTFQSDVDDLINTDVHLAAVPVWLEYVQFSIGGMGQPDGMKIIRETFDHALTSCGLHVTKGGNLWEAYREFENAILAGLLVSIQL